jgi:hypothetical protein
MLICSIRYQIDPTKRAEFAQYARNWGQAIPRCGADLIGYYGPHEGSSTLAYGIYDIPSQAERFLLREDRVFFKRVSDPHGEAT